MQQIPGDSQALRLVRSIVGIEPCELESRFGLFYSTKKKKKKKIYIPMTVRYVGDGLDVANIQIALSQFWLSPCLGWLPAYGC